MKLSPEERAVGRLSLPAQASSVPQGAHGGVPATMRGRPRVRGKFLFVGGEKLYIRGVTYGTFRPDADGNEYHPDVVERDFAEMAAHA